MRPFLFWGAMWVLGTVALHGETWRFASGEKQVSLIELFSSEGCSSCPPAERWLGTLSGNPGLWRDFVPVAFHVDYWNRLGWPDRFSSREFTQREYAYVAAWRSESVYTPCFVRDGAESRGTPKLTQTGRRTGVLIANYDGALLTAEFTPAGKADGASFEIHAALLGGGIASKVTAGENRGENLHHEFVALSLAHGSTGSAIALPRAKIPGVTRYALAVWVTRPGDLASVQATGGWLE